MTRPQRKRKPPVSADASPVAAAPCSTHAMASRKRSRPATAAALEDLNNAAVAAAEAEEAAQPKKPRGVKKPVRPPAEHAVAQAVPPCIEGHQAPADRHLDAVAAAPNLPATTAASMPHAASNQVAQQVQGAPAQPQTSPQGSGASQTSNPSSLLLLAQQQMQQRLNQQPQLPSSSSQEGLTQGSGLGNSQEQLQQLGNATAQQALLAQLITQQAAQGLTGYALDGSMHPFFSQGLAGALLRQGLPAQPQAGTDQEQSQQAAQQLSSHLQNSTAALLMQQGASLQMPQSGLLYPGQVITPGSILPITFPAQVAGTQPLAPQAGVASHAPQTAQTGSVESLTPNGVIGAQPQQSMSVSEAVAAAVPVSDQVSTSHALCQSNPWGRIHCCYWQSVLTMLLWYHLQTWDVVPLQKGVGCLALPCCYMPGLFMLKECFKRVCFGYRRLLLQQFLHKRRSTSSLRLLQASFQRRVLSIQIACSLMLCLRHESCHIKHVLACCVQ